MRICENGIYRDMTAEEISELEAMQAEYEAQEQPVNPIAPEYNNATVYRKGEYCSDGTSLFRCRVNYCRGIDTSNTNYWECISIADALTTITSEMEN